MTYSTAMRQFQPGTVENIERRIARSEYVSPLKVAQALREHGSEQVPPEVFDLACRHLEGRVRKPPGPKRNGARATLRRALTVAYYRRTLAWLQQRDRNCGLNGWSSLKEADWWAGPPHERAARMTAQRWHGGMITWQQVQNIVASAKQGGVIP